jgi:hypothetical protein
MGILMTKHHTKSGISKEITDKFTDVTAGPGNRAVPSFGARVKPVDRGWKPQSPPKQSTKSGLSTFAAGGTRDDAGKPRAVGYGRDALKGGDPVPGGKETSSWQPDGWSKARKG